MAISTDSGALTGNPVNDAYGTKTAAFDTEFTRLIPPRAGFRARASGAIYTAGTTAHTLSFMNVLGSTTVSTDAAAAQAVVAFTALPTAPDGSVIAAGDWVVLQQEDSTWVAHKVSSLSGLNVTMTANLAKKVKANTTVFFLGAPADHADRQYTVLASQTLNLVGSDTRLGLATAAADGQPILVHSNNVTAAGYLQWLGFTYGTA